MGASSSRHKDFLRKPMRRILIILLLLAGIFLIVQNSLSQIILDLAYADAYAMASKVINAAVAEVIRSGITYEELVTVQTNDMGQVTALLSNTIRMNNLATQIALKAQAAFQERQNQVIYIPLGSIFKLPTIEGSGPPISVKILPIGAITTQFVTEFESAGINQTRHRICLSIKATVRIVIPTGARQVDFISKVPICENVIVGAVPDTFVDTDRLDHILKLIR